jgi:phytoene dehydrogenase-like protein
MELDSGETVTATTILSSAGLLETMGLCADAKVAAGHRPAPHRTGETPVPHKAGRMTFMESISVLDCEPNALGFDQTITFYNNSERFNYRPAEDMVDTASAVVCVPNNFQYTQPLDEGMVRVTHIANFDRWKNLPEDEYKARKKEWYERSIEQTIKFVPDFRKHVKYIDTFTPRTIHHFTGHLNGAVYGSPDKVKDGRTPVQNLFIIGTDQGFLGIVGAMLSGISMANLHVLQAKPE